MESASKVDGGSDGAATAHTLGDDSVIKGKGSSERDILETMQAQHYPVLSLVTYFQHTFHIC